MSVQGTSVGLDVHARSVVACALDGRTGELVEGRLTPDYGELLAWLRSLPGPIEVTYEAGPTGFGLARFLQAEQLTCRVAAPSKLQRPSGDRVKTDTRDARHLARLLHLGEIVEVAVPPVETEAARDLVRAREDVRGDLMAARHRLSKLLLRQGIVYSGGKPWTGIHDQWLRRQRFGFPALQLTYDSVHDSVVAAVDRRDRLDTAIAEMAAASPFTPVVARLGCLRGVSTLTAFALAVEIGDWQRLSGRSIGAYLGLVPTESSSGGSRSHPGRDHQDRQQSRPSAADQGGLAPPRSLPPRRGPAPPLGPRDPCGADPRSPGQPPAPRPMGDLRHPQEAPRGRQYRDRPRARRLVLVAGRPRGRLTHRCPDDRHGGDGSALGATRERPMSRPATTARTTLGF